MPWAEAQTQISVNMQLKAANNCYHESKNGHFYLSFVNMTKGEQPVRAFRSDNLTTC